MASIRPVGQVGRVQVQQPHAVDPGGEGLDQRDDSPLALALVAPVGRQVLSHEHDLADAGGGEVVDLGQHRVERTAALLAAERRDGAEPARPVAALGHLDVGPRGARRGPGQVEQVERRGGRGRPGAGGPEGDRHTEPGHRVGLRQRLGQVVAVALGEAAGDDQLGPDRLALGQGEHDVDRLAAGVLDEGARVDDHQVGALGRVGRHQAVGQHGACQLVRVHLVLRTAQRLDPEGTGHRRQG